MEYALFYDMHVLPPILISFEMLQCTLKCEGRAHTKKMRFLLKTVQSDFKIHFSAVSFSEFA